MPMPNGLLEPCVSRNAFDRQVNFDESFGVLDHRRISTWPFADAFPVALEPLLVSLRFWHGSHDPS